jgi:TolA-binding protein
MSDNNTVSNPPPSSTTATPCMFRSLNLLHVGGEVIMFIILIAYFNMKMNGITTKVDDLKTTSNEQEDDIDELRNELKKLRADLQEQIDQLKTSSRQNNTEQTIENLFIQKQKPKQKQKQKQDTTRTKPIEVEDDESLYKYRTPLNIPRDNTQEVTRLKPPPIQTSFKQQPEPEPEPESESESDSEEVIEVKNNKVTEIDNNNDIKPVNLDDMLKEEIAGLD